jgi:peptide/nickel transport system substrate-binding protein
MSRFLLPAILLAVLCSCATAPGKVRTMADPHGGVFSFNETQPLTSIFPLEITRVAEQRVAAQIYEGLVRFNAQTLALEPALAESWNVDPSGTVYTFHLRKGVRFQDDPAFPGGDGRLLTAADVVHCFTSLCEKGTGDQAYWLFQDKVAGADAYHNSGAVRGRVSGIQDPDEQTVQITLTRPCPNFLQSIAGPGCWIWPKELVDTYGKDLFRHAIGTGPFQVKVSRPEEVVVLERNPNYWGRDDHGAALPFLDAVRITFVPDKEEEIAQFQQGHLSMITELSLQSIGLLADSVDTRTGKRRFNVFSSPAMAVQYYGFNASKPPFNDIRVRKAFALALNRHMLVDSVLHGMVVAADHGLVPPGLSGYPYNLVKGIPFDPDSARALLAQAGFPGGKGFPRIQLQVNNSGFGYRSVASKVQEELGRELGVAITVSAVPPQEYYERIENGEALFWREGWVADLPDPENFLALVYGKNAVQDTALASSLNTTRYADPRFDALFARSMTHKNEQDRMHDLAEADNIAMQDVPLLPLYHERYIVLLDPKVEQLGVNPMELLDLRLVKMARPVAQARGADTSSYAMRLASGRNVSMRGKLRSDSKTNVAGFGSGPVRTSSALMCP